MKKPLAALVTLALLTTSGAAFAASSVDLTVKGLITPSACTPTLSANGVVDHGKISAKDLNQDTATILPITTLKLSVNCDGETLFALGATDNRSNSSSSAGGFGLGLIDNTQKIGAFFLDIGNALADNVAARTMVSTDEGKTWSYVEGAIWNHPDLMAFGLGTPTPMLIKDLLTDMRVHTRIEPAKDLSLTNEVVLDGSATLEVKYL